VSQGRLAAPHGLVGCQSAAIRGALSNYITCKPPGDDLVCSQRRWVVVLVTDTIIDLPQLLDDRGRLLVLFLRHHPVFSLVPVNSAPHAGKFLLLSVAVLSL